MPTQFYNAGWTGMALKSVCMSKNWSSFKNPKQNMPMIHLPFIVMETHEITTLYIFKQKGVCLTLDHKDWDDLRSNHSNPCETMWKRVQHKKELAVVVAIWKVNKWLMLVVVVLFSDCPFTPTLSKLTVLWKCLSLEITSTLTTHKTQWLLNLNHKTLKYFLT